MKKILILLLFCGFWANAQQYHDKGAKFEFATNEGDTITVNTRIPIIDEFGLVNYYVDVADLLALNPAPVLEWGNITGTLSNQTDLQGALNDKADQSDLTAHTSNGNIHFTQSAISITESQITDLKDYLRGDINDTNGANKLTLGSLEVTGQTILQNGLNMSSVPVGTSNNILTLNQTTGDVEQRVFSLGDIDIANAAGTNQFPVGLGDQLRFEGSGDTSISFDGVTNTINITSVPGSGTGGAVTSFNGRTGGVVSEAGDYSTAMVNENTNLYFTEPRVRATPLTGLTVTNTPISSTNTFLQALGRLQGQINNREVSFSKNTAFNKNFGTSAGTVAQGNDSRINNGQTAFSWGNHASAGYAKMNTVNNGSFLASSTITSGGDIFIPGGSWLKNEGGDRIIRRTPGGFVNVGGDQVTNPVAITLYADSEVRLKNFVPLTDDLGYQYLNMTNNGFLRIGDGNPGTITLFGGSDPRYNDGTNNYTFWHAGNFTPSDYVPNARTITAGDGLVGGGNLSGNITLDVVGSGGITTTGNAVTLTPIAAGSTSFGALQYQGTSRSAGKLYGGTTNPISTTRLNYDGHLFVSELTSIGDVTANSDKRLKKNIKRIDNALSIVQLLSGYEYDRKDVDLHQAGVIAQEVEEVFPVAVSEDANGTKSVAYNHLIALLIEAVKEQQIEIEELKTMINEK